MSRMINTGAMLLFAVASAALAGAADTKAAVPASPKDVTPLKAGETAPTATLKDAGKENVDLAKIFASKPTVLIFYRGSWCPYCTAHLADMAKAEPKLIEMGFQIIAVSPDKPADLKKMADSTKAAYQLLSDEDHAFARAYGVSFGAKHELPVPSVYIIGKDKTILFAHWEADYKKRLKADEVIAAASKVKVE